MICKNSYLCYNKGMKSKLSKKKSFLKSINWGNLAFIPLALVVFAVIFAIIWVLSVL
jgi:hypothetical protein